MGLFISGEFVKAKSRLDEVRSMETEDIEILLIRPAESRIEDAFDLDLDTDAQPRRWVGQFDRFPGKLIEFHLDMKSALIILIDRMAGNPHGYSTQSVRGASVSFGKSMPTEVTSLLNKWGTSTPKTGRIFRT